MRYKQSNLKRVSPAKKWILKATAGAILSLILPFVGSAPAVFAAGDASFSFASSGSTTVGGTFTVTVNETSTSGDNVNAVDTEMSYPSNLLQFQSATLGTSFDLSVQSSGGGGSVSVVGARKGSDVPPTVSGTQTAAIVTFSVLAAGTASVHLVSGSDIDNTSGSSVWDGTLTSATYSLSANTSSGSTSGGSSGGTATKKAASSPTNTATGAPGGGSTGTKATTPTTPSTTTSPTTAQTPAAQPAAPAASAAALTVTVTDADGKPVKGAKVSVDDQYNAITDANGKASLSGLSAGNHKVTVTASGKATTTSTLQLSANENKQVSLKLTSKQSLAPVLYVVLGLIVLGGGAVALMKLRGGGMKGPQFPVSGIVVGSGNTPSTPSQPTATIQPTPSTPQVVTGNQSPPNLGASSGNTPKIQ